MSRFLLATLACLALAHDAAAQSAQPATTPAKAAAQGGTIAPGTWDLDITFGGGVLPGVLVLTARGDSLAATLQVGEHTSPITSVTRKGSTLLLAGGAEGMELEYTLRFKGDALTGTYTFNGERGELTGRRRR